MLPMMILQPSEIATFDTGLNSSGLLPQEAGEPSAAFAEILRNGLEPGGSLPIPDGITLPQDGNELPLIAAFEIEEAPVEAAEDLIIPLPEIVHVALPAAPSASATPTALTPVPDGAGIRAMVHTEGVTLPRAGVPAGMTDAGLADGEPPLARDPATLATLAAAAPRQNPAPNQALGPLPGEQTDAAQSASALVRHLDDAALRDRRPALGVSAQALARSDGLTAPGPVATSDAGPPDLMARTTVTPVTQVMPQQPMPAGIADTPVTQPVQPTIAPAGPVHAASNAESAAPTTQLTQTIDTPVRESAWREAIGERVLLMASNRLQSAEIRLTPAELGPLRIQVALDDGAANVSFIAQHAVTREAIEQALPRLRELLAENGLTLNQTSVGESGGEGAAQGNREGADDAAPVADSAGDTAGEAAAVQSSDAPRTAARADSLVDTFV